MKQDWLKLGGTFILGGLFASAAIIIVASLNTPVQPTLVDINKPALSFTFPRTLQLVDGHITDTLTVVPVMWPVGALDSPPITLLAKEYILELPSGTVALLPGMQVRVTCQIELPDE